MGCAPRARENASHSRGPSVQAFERGVGRFARKRLQPRIYPKREMCIYQGVEVEVEVEAFERAKTSGRHVCTGTGSSLPLSCSSSSSETSGTSIAPMHKEGTSLLCSGRCIHAPTASFLSPTSAFVPSLTRRTFSAISHPYAIHAICSFFLFLLL